MNHSEKDSIYFHDPYNYSSAGEKDAIDILKEILKQKAFRSSQTPPKKLQLSVIPGLTYGPATGLLGSVSANMAYYASAKKDQKLSTISPSVSYSLKDQKTLSLSSVIFTKNNNYNFSGYWWYSDYSENTYGLGSLTTGGKKNLLSYTFVRFYESILKKVYYNIYAGIGYNLDYHYHIREKGNKDASISDWNTYSKTQHSTSSGLSLNFSYDSRKNPINPQKGSYLNMVYSPKLKFLKSDGNWQSLQLDIRTYKKPSAFSHNILAFWSLLWFTLQGNPPYLDLPSTGWDSQQNTGRGYIQGRFRGRNMVYFESEYRFSITHNGLLGAVVFANAESFSEGQTYRFEKLLPAAGVGLRIKFNKKTGTNLCFDYAIGTKGSNGFFVNLGEVF